MKKLMMTAVLAASIFATGTLTAQSAQATTKPTEATAIAPQQDYKEIKASELPDAVTTAVQRDFKGAAIAKAYVNNAKIYKLELKTAEGQSKTVYANAKGEWVKKM